MTVTRVTLHIVNPQQRERALALLRKNTELAREAAGFVSRHVYFAQNDPMRGYSITTFHTRADMDTFSNDPRRPRLSHEGEERRVYEETPEGRYLLFTHTTSDICELVDEG